MVTRSAIVEKAAKIYQKANGSKVIEVVDLDVAAGGWAPVDPRMDEESGETASVRTGYDSKTKSEDYYSVEKEGVMVKEPILFLDVNLGHGKTAKVVINKGEDIYQVVD